MPATARIFQHLRARGVTVLPGTEVTGFLHDAWGAGGAGDARGTRGAVRGVRTTASAAPVIHARHVVNAAGIWSGRLGELAGAPIPVLPRRGFVLVTEPLTRVVRHKVYTAEYVANVAGGEAGLETSVVVEGTRAGTVLTGAGRERVGFDRTMSLPVLRKLAAQALIVFPLLAEVRLLRAYMGFRPDRFEEATA
ncbi:NAD(P)/FAD-dependent oxidoreductase [Streptomyces sp. NPDC050509]|uniref:NAD(P)/FAD-dependent oxidoreductase n=1 Tax=Streptomyces sp. NPDC050509 TaxID=3365620 RepID=UPI0037A92588